MGNDYNRKIDELIATRIMGWQRMTYGQWFVLRHPDRSGERWAKDDRPDNGWFTASGECQGLSDDEPDWYDDPQERWSPSTDIAAAWQVVVRMRERFTEIEIRETQLSFSYTTVVICGHDEVIAETTTLAICLAALKAYGITPPTEDSDDAQ